MALHYFYSNIKQYSSNYLTFNETSRIFPFIADNLITKVYHMINECRGQVLYDDFFHLEMCLKCEWKCSFIHYGKSLDNASELEKGHIA